MDEQEIQTRSTLGDCRIHSSIDNAFIYAFNNPSVWKISFSVGKESVRLIKTEEGWLYEDVYGNRWNNG